MYAVLENSVYGFCFLPIIPEYVSGYDPANAGSQEVTVQVLGHQHAVTITRSDCDHSYQAVTTESTCLDEGFTTYTCTGCGEQYIGNRAKPLGHLLNEWYTVDPPYCTTSGLLARDCVRPGCGFREEKESAPIGHGWDAGTVIREASGCTDGLMRYSCLNYCGATKEEVIPAPGHEYTEETVAPTCTEAGYTQYTCGLCGYTYQANHADPLGHSMRGWEEVTPATCSAPGLEQRSCFICNAIEEREIPQLEEHTMGQWTVTVEAGCEVERIETRKCTVCGYEETRKEAALGHDLGQWETHTPATCGAPGLERKYCSRCTYYEEQQIPTLEEHIMGQWSIRVEAGCEQERIEVRKCESCGYEEIRKEAALGHDMLPWQTLTYPSCDGTGSERRSCSRCGYAETRETEAAGHDYQTTVTDPTCTREGCSTHSCSRCGHSYVDTTVEALGHSYQAVVTAPDCEHGGYTTYTCTRCSHSYIAEETEAQSHDWHEDTAVLMTTQNTQKSICYTCQNCSAEVTGKVYTTGSDPCESGHSLTEWTVAEEATCTALGVLQRSCGNCDYEEFREIPQKGHHYLNSVTAATCEEGGFTTHICSDCGEKYADGYTPALDHVLNDWTWVEAATCEASGLERRGCTRCEHTQEREVPASGHDYASVIAEPSCEAEGYTTYSCTQCGDSHVGDHVEALGHAMGDAYTVTEASCTKPGIRRRDCSRCDYCEESVIPIGEHAYRALVTAPGCLAHGYTTHICTACGDSYVDSYLDALGHRYKDGSCVDCGVSATPVEIASGWSGATQWTLTSDGTLTIYGKGNMKNYGYNGGQPWLGKGVDIICVVIEEGVTSVGSGAFRNLTTLKSVTFPQKSLTKMGEAAFYGSGLTSVEIPASLWTIQPYTFKNCAELKRVRFHEGNLQKISNGAFYGTGLTELVLPDCLDILDVYAFKGCADLTFITIGTGLTELREAVFYGTAIHTIEIPEGITKIGPYAFKNCAKLETVNFPDSLVTVGEASFYACTGLKTVALPEGVTAIGNYAFRKCSGITTLTLSEELTTIGECAFYGCTGLRDLVIPDNVTTIKPYAFKTCTGLTSVTLGKRLQSIGEGAFNTCTGLKTIEFPASLTSIGNYSFSGSYNLWNMTFLGDAPFIGTGAFKGLNATAYYPGGNASWSADIMQNYGGQITWKTK